MKPMFERLPEGWSKKRIGDLGQLYSGATPSTLIDSYWGNEIVWVTPNDLSMLKTRHIKESERQITALGLQNCSAHLLPRGSLIISSRAPIGYLAIAQTEFCTNQGCKSLVFSPDQHPDFHYYNLLFRVRAIREKGEGTTFAEISKSALASIEIPVPDDMSEQTAIADILTTVDRAIEQTEALIAKQRRIKAGLLHDLLTRGIDEHGRLRDPSTHRFKPSPVGLVPEEWEVKKITEVLTFPTGQIDPRQLPYLDWPLVAPDHIEQGTGRLLEVKTAREQGAISGKYCFMPGDVVYSKIRPYLRKAILAEFQGLCSADMYPLRPMQNVTPGYLHMLILGEHFSRFAEAVSERSGFPKINRQEMSEYSLVLPELSEQLRIEGVFSTLANLQHENTQQLAKLLRLKAGLMQDLLSGRVLVAELTKSVHMC